MARKKGGGNLTGRPAPRDPLEDIRELMRHNDALIRILELQLSISFLTDNERREVRRDYYMAVAEREALQNDYHELLMEQALRTGTDGYGSDEDIPVPDHPVNAPAAGGRGKTRRRRGKRGKTRRRGPASFL
jgi:hypothetical protein